MDIKKNWYRIIGLGSIIILIYLTINNLNYWKNVGQSVLTAFMPFIGGLVLAFILNLLVVVIEKYLTKWLKSHHKWYRIFSITVSFILFVLLLLALIFLVIPDLQHTISSFIDYVPQKINEIIKIITDFMDNNPEIIDFVQEVDLDLDSLQNEVISYIQSLTTNIIGGTFDFLLSMINSVVKVFIAVIFAFYLLMIKEKLIQQVKKVIYGLFSLPWANYIVNVGRKANEIFSNFMGGQLIEGFILGFLVYVGMWIFGFPYKLSISTITGVMVFIPVYGALLGGVLGFILISVINFPQAVGFAIFIIVLQQIESNLIYPRVVGNSIGLPGIWVLFAVTVGGSLFGLIGIIIGVPMTSLMYALISAQINHQLERRSLTIETDSNNL